MNIFGVKIEVIVRLIRELALIVLALIVITKVLNANLTFDFSKLSATDLVALLLAIFSIALSAAFYFAATNSSAKFYDNMHNFTKDTSVILGTLTERLNSVDKGQDEVKNRFDKLYENGSAAKNLEAVEKEKEKKESVDKNRDELKETIYKLIDKVQLPQQERDKIIKDFTHKEEKLTDSLDKLSEIRSENKHRAETRAFFHTIHLMRSVMESEKDPLNMVIRKMLSLPGNSKYMSDLFLLGYINDVDSIGLSGVTNQGYEYFKKVYNKEAINVD